MPTSAHHLRLPCLGWRGQEQIAGNDISVAAASIGVSFWASLTWPAVSPSGLATQASTTGACQASSSSLAASGEGESRRRDPRWTKGMLEQSSPSRDGEGRIWVGHTAEVEEIGERGNCARACAPGSWMWTHQASSGIHGSVGRRRRLGTHVEVGTELWTLLYGG
jgi:hypothetical protein